VHRNFWNGKIQGLAKKDNGSSDTSIVDSNGFLLFEEQKRDARDDSPDLFSPCRCGADGKITVFLALCLELSGFALHGAQAADLPAIDKAPAPAVASAFDWTGFYAGVNGGAGLDHASTPYILTLPTGMIPGVTGMTERGPLFGGQVGYNYEFTNVPWIGHAVAGLELDSDWADINGAASAATGAGLATFGTRIENFGTLRGRVGYNFDRLLLYIGGGFSYATVESYYTGPGYSGATTVTRLPLRFSAYTIGAEYALADRWTIRAEYMYDYIAAKWREYDPTPGVVVNFPSRATFHVARIGLNYQFDFFAPNPIVAKY
jgi:outer membrane immunogenic protein